MHHHLLDGIRILVLGGDPAARAGRVLADLGADVVRVVPTGADPLAARPGALQAWSHRTTVVEASDADDTSVAIAEARRAAVVIDTPHDATTIVLDPACAPNAHWVRITPFGLDGPRAHWRATDLGIMASTGNMFATGDPDRAPIRAAEPTSHAHVGGEAAFAALSAIASGRRQIVDLSMQECVMIASMGSPGRSERSGARGKRLGANIGRTREIWPTVDGFVSFGIRGGKARQASMEIITRLVREAGLDSTPLERDWAAWSQNTAPDDELAAMEAVIGEYFSTRSMSDLYAIAVATNLMLAPANSPREALASEQLAARGFFAPAPEFGLDAFPDNFVIAHVAERMPEPRPLPEPGAGLWSGLRLLEFGSGAAGPIATRYFVEHGATVLRIESRSRPDFLRAMAIGPDNPHGLEGSDMYDGLNCSKLNLTLNLKHPDAVAIARRLAVEWADCIAENYAPKAMRGFGLDYPTLQALRPDLVMISACLNGQTGPHKDYPGFGGQGSALSGWNWVTGWPDREPVGPHGTITDSLAPRYVAAALAAGLLHHRRTGRGCHLDIAQVETGLYALSPWLVDYITDGTVGMRSANRSASAVPHGAFPCAPEPGGVDDRWVAIACHSDAEWATLAAIIGRTDPALATLSGRQTRVDEVEAAVAAWTATRSRAEVAAMLQQAGIEAVPVADFVDARADEQLAHRHHFVTLDHPVLGRGAYERNGLRCSDAISGYSRSGPTLGQDTDTVLREFLGLDASEIEQLRTAGALD